MNYLHLNLKIIHRNLKCENIFLNKDGTRIKAKIGNFECALHSLSNEDSRQFNVGTLNFSV
jgi:serine/threonine protein kinase